MKFEIKILLAAKNNTLFSGIIKAETWQEALDEALELAKNAKGMLCGFSRIDIIMPTLL